MDLRTWQVDLGYKDHVVVIDKDSKITGAPKRFRLDDSSLELKRAGRSRPISSSFRIDGHPATLTRTTQRPGFVQRLRSALNWRTLLGAVVGGLFLGPVGHALGVAAGPMGGFRARLVYELAVDGQSQGAWVFSVQDDGSGAWIFEQVPADPWPRPAKAG